jgi:uncharacterized membrane protein YjdF
VVSGVQDSSLIIFLAALETAFFGMLPVAYSTGRGLFRWNKLIWVVLFIPITFVFNHALLNPGSEFLASFAVSNVRFMWAILFILVTFTGWLWFYFNVVDDILQEWVGLKRRSGRTPPMR